MRNVIRIFLLVIVAAVLFVNSRPNTFHVERSITVSAPAEAVFPRIADFHRWAAWSPWEKLDPQMRADFIGEPGAIGSSYHWAGNNKVGEGRMTLREAVPSSKVGIQLDFLKPWQSTNLCAFTLAPDGGGTRVTWALDGNNNFMAKVMGLFTSMDKMIGPDFEKGLASLKTGAESAPAADSTRAAVSTTGVTAAH